MAIAVDPVDPLDALAEEFLSRRRRGERPSLDEYTANNPELAERIRSLFPTLEAIEALGANLEGDHQPDRLGEYRIVRPLGRGGMGVVYEAVQEPLGRRVALKVLSGEPRSKSSLLERFQREARTAARLHHGNIVPVFGVGVDAGVYYIAMQFIDGQGLDKVIEEIRQLRGGHGSTSRLGSTWLSNDVNNYERKVVALMVQATDAVAYAHSRGVLHRDIKPSNLLLDMSGTLWVADFGLAKEAGDEDLTTTGDVVGTLKYLAPERLTGPADERSDVYSLGATLYELLTLRPAFEGSDRPALMERITRGDPTPPRKLQSHIPADLENVVLKAMDRDSQGRYRSAAAMADDLRRFLDGRATTARMPGLLERSIKWARRRPALAALLFVTLASLVVILAMAWNHTNQLEKALAETSAAQQRAQENLQTLYESVSQYMNAIDEDSRLRAFDLSDVRLRLMSDALPILERISAQTGSDPQILSRRVLAYYKIGQIKYDRADYAGVQAAANSELGVLKQLRDLEPDNLNWIWRQGSAHNQLAASYYGQNDLKTARKCIDQGLEIIRPAVARAPDSDAGQHRLASLVADQAKFDGATGNWRDSEKGYAEAIKLFAKLNERGDAPESRRLAAAHCQFGLGQALDSQNRSNEAVVSFRAAFENLQAIQKTAPKEREVLLRLARAADGLASILIRTGQLTEAEVVQSVGIHALGQIDGDVSKEPSRAISEAKYHSNYGGSLADLGRFELALEQFDQALAKLMLVRESAENKDPRWSNFNRITLMKRAHALWNLRRFEEAESAFRRGLEATTLYLHRQPNGSKRTEVAASLFNGQIDFVWCLNGAGKHSEAILEMESAAKLAINPFQARFARIKLAGLLVKNCDAKRGLETAQQVLQDQDLEGIISYDGGWIYALLSSRELDPQERERLGTEAVRLLRQAAEKGYFDPQQLATFPDFAPLRERDDFKKLLLEYRTRTNQKRGN